MFYWFLWDGIVDLHVKMTVMFVTEWWFIIKKTLYHNIVKIMDAWLNAYCTLCLMYTRYREIFVVVNDSAHKIWKSFQLWCRINYFKPASLLCILFLSKLTFFHTSIICFSASIKHKHLLSIRFCIVFTWSEKIVGAF